MLAQKQAEEAIVSNETEHEANREEDKETGDTSLFNVKSFLWHGGSAWDAWCSCASNQMLLYSIAWSSWVPYMAAMVTLLAAIGSPCVRSIASKQVGPSEQGKAQGCLTGICSIANVVSPLAFSPLTGMRF